MPKEKKVSRPPKPASGGSRDISAEHAPKMTAYAGAAVALVLGVVLSWKLAQRPRDAVREPAGEAREAEALNLGPEVMSSQTPVLQELMDLLGDVEASKGAGSDAARDAALHKAERRLQELEKQMDGASQAGKQQLGLVSLVRSALEMEKKGEDMAASEWNEESLMEKHGVTTYASQQYWDEAYGDKKYGENYDWYGNWAEPTLQGHSLGDLVRPLLKSDGRILVQGCGNSNMSALMYAEGFKQIANVDISVPVIEHMRQHYSHIEEMTWQAMDSTALDFADGSFDVVIEKGLFDALFAGTGTKTQPALAEARRVLKTGGRLISVSFNGNRVETLFHAASALPGLRCSVLSELQYTEAKDAKDKNSHDFFVYVCNRE